MGNEIERRFRRTSREDLRAEKLPRRIPPWNKGDSITAHRLTEMVNGVNRATSVASAQQTNSQRERQLGVYEARIIREIDDFLVCELFELSSNPELVVVAKPFTLRRKPHEDYGRGLITYAYSDTAGQRTATFTDQVTGEEVSETHYISPAYIPRSLTEDGDIVYVTNNVIGGVGLFVSSFELSTQEGAPEHFIDLNVDGRQWAAEVPCEPAVELNSDPTQTAT